ncbi:MAG: metal-dependent hydrolase [Nevskia sp.]|nr:metal-dependent hydrolase [Nevskia sp.]
MTEKPTIVPRQDLDFDLDGDIPRFWFAGDAFKTRLFDAFSVLFPEGERFFINCVRDYRERISDPVQQQQVKDFIRQEGQHGMIHDAFNRRLTAQGIRVDQVEKVLHKLMEDERRFFPKKFTLACTAAAEHMTAVTTHGFSVNGEQFLDADRRVNAMYLWHGMEEIEHKAVAFDVLQQVARGGYLVRLLAMLYTSITFPLTVFSIMSYMFKVDGFGFRQRLGLWWRGLRWMYGRNGLYSGVAGHYWAWYRPGFHPWKHGGMETYQAWLAEFQRSGDPLAAADAVRAVVTGAAPPIAAVPA